jgi:hypothetical protein
VRLIGSHTADYHTNKCRKPCLSHCLATPLNPFGDISEIRITNQQRYFAMSQRDQVTASFPCGGDVIGRDRVKFAIRRSPVDKNRWDFAFTDIFKCAGTVAARDQDQAVGLTPDKGPDSLQFSIGIFLGVDQKDLVIASGCELLDATDDACEEAGRDVWHNNPDHA